MSHQTYELAVGVIATDGGTQIRVNGLNEEQVANYVDALERHASFPPIDVFHDGTNFWLADGFHRLEAHKRAGREKITARVEAGGSQREARLFAAGANSDNGLPRSRADRWHAVEVFLDDEKCQALSDREIARRARVSHTFVSKVRKSREPNAGDDSGGNVATPKPKAADTEAVAKEVIGTPDTPPVTLANALAETGTEPEPEEPEVQLSQWFTPPELALVAAKLVPRGCTRILEPSAGTGNLIAALADVHGADIVQHVDAVELDAELAAHLRGRFETLPVYEGNYLERPAPAHPYECTLMNPPYENGQDGEFLAKAMQESLRIVAVLRANTLFGDGRTEGIWKNPLWSLTRIVRCSARPRFATRHNETTDSPRHDFVAIRMVNIAGAKCTPEWLHRGAIYPGGVPVEDWEVAA